jgi:hypothetical protein
MGSTEAFPSVTLVMEPLVAFGKIDGLPLC